MSILNRMVSCALMLCCASAVWADSKIITTVNGTPETRDLVTITFDDDNVILNYSDNTTDRVEMKLVNITLIHDEQSSLKEILTDKDLPAGVYNLKGQRIADTPEGLKEGIYIINGHKMLVK